MLFQLIIVHLPTSRRIIILLSSAFADDVYPWRLLVFLPHLTALIRIFLASNKSEDICDDTVQLSLNELVISAHVIETFDFIQGVIMQVIIEAPGSARGENTGLNNASRQR